MAAPGTSASRPAAQVSRSFRALRRAASRSSLQGIRKSPRPARPFRFGPVRFGPARRNPRQARSRPAPGFEPRGTSPRCTQALRLSRSITPDGPAPRSKAALRAPSLVPSRSSWAFVSPSFPSTESFRPCLGLPVPSFNRTSLLRLRLRPCLRPCLRLGLRLGLPLGLEQKSLVLAFARPAADCSVEPKVSPDRPAAFRRWPQPGCHRFCRS